MSFNKYQQPQLSRYYIDAFMTAYLPNTDTPSLLTAWLRDHAGTEVINKITPSSPFGNAIRAMGIGTGEGSIDSVIIEVLRQRFNRVSYTVVEPSRLIDLFKQRVEAEDDPKVSFDWSEKTFEDFCLGERENHGKFQLISCIYSMMHFTDFTESMSRLVDSLTENGALLIAVSSDSSDLTQFYNAVRWQKNAGIKYSISERIEQFAKSRDLPLTTFDLPGKIDVTSCFNEESLGGRKLLNFLVGVGFLQENTRDNGVREVLSILDSIVGTPQGGKKYLSTVCNVMVLFNKA